MDTLTALEQRNTMLARVFGLIRTLVFSQTVGASRLGTAGDLTKVLGRLRRIVRRRS